MAKKSFSNNSKVNQYLASLSQDTIETSDIETRCKFNFSYFIDSQDAGQSFREWSKVSGIDSLNELMDKIKQYTKQPLNYWKTQRAGKLNVLEYYGDFPKNSDFTHPPSVPEDAYWARFRLGNKVRLIGFVIHKSSISALSTEDQSKYCLNTFYVVFLDSEHRFYKTEKP